MDIRVLGPLEVLTDNGQRARLGSPKLRTLLSVLVLADGRPVAPGTLLDTLWGAHTGTDAQASLHTHVSNLRRLLEPDRTGSAPSRWLTFGPLGYTLTVTAEDVDAGRFLPLVGRAEQAGEPTETERLATQALQLWRGEPYQDLDDQTSVTAVRARLTEARERARELRVGAIIDQGRHDEVLGELEALTFEHPLRERLWALRALALYRGGRQGEALEALRTARRILDEELGVDPSEQLETLERAILDQSPALLPHRGPRPSVRGRAMVGRGTELTALEDLLSVAAAGVPGFALITGEPGIGKTRLVEEVASRAHARGFAVAVGRCAATEGAPAFWPWVTILARLEDAVAALPAEIRAELPGVDSATANDPEGARFRTYEAAARALTAGGRPVLVVLDDLHWADRSSLRLLAHLAHSVSEGELAVIGTAREHPAPEGALAEAFEALARRHALRFALTGLSVSDLAELVPTGADPRALRDRTNGNPFFVTELLRFIDAGSSRPGTLPLGVRDAVLGRVSDLPAPSAELLRIAAVTGREFDAAIVAEAAGLDLDTALDRLEPAITAGLLGQGRPGRFLFVHALVREALTEVVPLSRRARLHAAVAAAVESRIGSSSGAAADAAHHWFQAIAAGHTTRARRAARRAAEEASRLRAYDDAVDLLERAARLTEDDLGPGDPETLDTLFALAEAKFGAGDALGQQTVLTRIRHAARQTGDRRRGLAAATGYGGRILQPWQVYGDVDLDLVADLKQWAADETLEPRERARVLSSLALHAYYHPEYGPAHRERWSAEAVRLARGENDAILLGRVLFARYYALLDPDSTRHRLAAAEEMVRAGSAAGDIELHTLGLTCQGGTLLELCRVSEALPVLAAAERSIDRTHMPYLRVMLGWLRLGLFVHRGDLEGAQALLAATEAEHRATSMWGAESSTMGAAYQVSLLRLRLEKPATPAPLGDLSAVRLDEYTADGHAHYLVTAGDVAGARQALGPWERQPPLPKTFVYLFWLVIRCEVWAALGDRQACEDLYREATPYADLMGIAGLSLLMWPVSRSLAQLATALGDTDSARRHAEHAERVEAQLRRPHR
ncbi:AfsR/SARP family transcriptional regulator [Nocardia arizonensis]|uniref:AfsR/SARP family transcriptional regulator n=1 Tax=Nocardia arizonensis TaxID=1141647 RepID=UPI0006D263C2|nr:AfsR/SARP family transcriptional regulator [Nocardia arizonensis]